MRSEVVQYLKYCYQADNRHQTLWNVFDKDAVELYCFDQNDLQLMLGRRPIPIAESLAQHIIRTTDTYRREKRLVLACYLLCGTLNSRNIDVDTDSAMEIEGDVEQPFSNKNISAPLLLCNATCITTDKKHYLEVDIDLPEWNTPLLQKLLPDRERLDQFFTLAQAKSPFDDVRSLINALREYSEAKIGISSEMLENADAVNRLLNTHTPPSELVLSPSFALTIVDRGIRSRGVLDELGLIAEADTTSAPLRLLDAESTKTVAKNGGPKRWWRQPKGNADNVPGLLSNAQRNVLDIGATQTLGMVIGPPGTGKSYTIASVALDRFMAGENVLIVSNTEFAVDVVWNKLVDTFGLSQDAVIRAGSRDYHKQLKNYLDNLSRGQLGPLKRTSYAKQIKSIRKQLNQGEAQLVKNIHQAEKDGAVITQTQTKALNTWFERFTLWRINARARNGTLLHNQLKRLQGLHNLRETTLAKHIDSQLQTRKQQTLTRNRNLLTKFRQAIGARTSNKQAKVFAEIDFSQLLNTIPIWLCSLDALHRVLPLQAHLFDLVIVDEATQCDLASALPALYRARRALIFGDPQQLRHVSFLSRQRQAIFAKKLELAEVPFSYRDHSLIDLAEQNLSSQVSVCMLDEHFRSQPEIIRFSNHHFYNKRLRIMTEKPGRVSPKALTLHYVANATRQVGINSVEAECLITDLAHLIQSQSTIPLEHKLTVGIVSFFQDQAKYLQQLLFEKIALSDIQAHNIRTGTPYAFQGEERDIILLSCGVTAQCAAGSFSYMNRADVFNVAITRARKKQSVYYSLQLDDIPQNNLLRRYIQFINSYRQPLPLVEDERKRMLEYFMQVFSNLGIEVISNYSLAGLELDLVLQKDEEVIAIDLVGFPGYPVQEVDIYRYHIFERAGLAIIPIAYTNWREKSEQIISNIEQEFVQQQERNTAARLAVSDFNRHWTKLLSYDAVIAKSVRHIEADLIALGYAESIDKLGRLIEQFKLLHLVLREKLNPAELTFIRYTNASEQLLLSCMDLLNKIVLLGKSLTKTAANPQTRERNARIEQHLSSIDKAITQLEQMTLKWSATNTRVGLGNESIEVALASVESLLNNVDNYDIGNKDQS